MLCEVPLTKEQQDFAAEHHGLSINFSMTTIFQRMNSMMWLFSRI